MNHKPDVKPLPVSAWDPKLQAIIQDMQGSPLNVHQLMAHNPNLSLAWWGFRNHMVSGGSLGKRRSELAILRVAVNLGCWYEWASHVDRGMASGLAHGEVERVKAGPDAPAWEEADALLLRAVDELMANHALAKSTEDALRQHFSVAQIMDLMSLQGMYIILGCMVNTWGLELDEAVAARLPPGITRENFDKANN